MKVSMKVNKKHIGPALYVVYTLVLITLGVAGTLKYQSFIDNVKSDGVAEFVLSDCDKYTDKKTTWLECDIK